MSERDNAGTSEASLHTADLAIAHIWSLSEIKTEVKQEPAEQFEEEEIKYSTDEIPNLEVKEETSQHWDEEEIKYIFKQEGEAEDPLAPDPTTEVDEPKEEDSTNAASPTENRLAFPCSRCDKVYTSVHCLKMHHTTCQGLKKQAARVKPEKVSTDVPSLIIVMDGVKMYCCQFCEYKSNNRGHVKQHLVTHTGVKAFKCEMCEKTFALASHLTLHRRTHTGEKPHKCEVCEKTFALASNLTKHRRTHTRDKPHKCTECDRAFTQAGSLKEHMTTHTGERPFPCQMCEYKAAHRKTLLYHMRVHSGETPYSSKCGYRATTSSTLKTHIRTKHTSDKPLSCAHCEFRTPVKGELSSHMKRKHIDISTLTHFLS